MIMPKKPLSFMNCHAVAVRSRWTALASQSLVMAQSASVSSSTKRCSSSLSVGMGVESRRDQSGRPEKSSPSHHTVPASSASRSVCDIGGITLRYSESTPSLMSLRRSEGIDNGIARTTNATIRTRVSAVGSAWNSHAAASATAMPTPHVRPDALT
jgi:hypothetical protein